MIPANTDSTGGPSASPGDVVKYLVQNEPLTYVAEMSGYVDGYTSQLKRDSFAMQESLNASIDAEKQIVSSIDELLRECQGSYSGVKKRTKEAENIINTRSQDLHRAIAQLRSTPLTTPPVSSLGLSNSLIVQMSAKVEEIGTAQREVLNALEADRNRLKVTLGELSNRGESMELLLGTFMRPTDVIPPSRTPLLDLEVYDSLWARYQRGSQELQSGVGRIVKNSETIRDLALVLERVHGPDITTTPLAGGSPTLAEELSVWRLQNAETAETPPPNPHNQALHWSSVATRLGSLKVWAGCPTRDSLVLVFTHLPVRPSFLVSTSLMVLFILVNIMRARHRVGSPDHGQSITQTTPFHSIRDLLLGDKANMPDEFIRNLVPRG